jgi:hypothetical protein
MTEPLVFDLDSLTLGEIAMGEEASGKRYDKLLASTAYRSAFVLMVLASRNGEPVPSWHSLMSLKVRVASSSISDSLRASLSQRSPASE